MQETWVLSLGWKDPLKKGIATHSSILAWRIPWTEEPCGLQSMGPQRVRHDGVTNTPTHQKGNPNFEETVCIRGIEQVAAAAAVKSLQSCPTLCDPIDGSPPGSARPWISPGKNTGVGCHFPLQCMKVKSEREVSQSCLTLRDPMDCSLPGSSVHGIFPGKSAGVGCHCLLQQNRLWNHKDLSTLTTQLTQGKLIL